jgi:hypothetical protein
VVNRLRDALVIVLAPLVFATSAFAGSITLEWDPPTESGVAGFIVSYGLVSRVYTSARDVGSVTRYQVTGLADGTRYCFAVRAYNTTGGRSDYSTEVCGTTPTATTSTTSQPKLIAVNQGGDLQAAINAALPGDTIVLQAGATFVGNFVLPFKRSATGAYVTIRSSAADSTLPPAGTRMTPAYASRLPKLRSPNGNPALATAPGAHHYAIRFVEFLANASYAGNIIELGNGTATQSNLDIVPSNLVFDRVYVHGDPVRGQLRAFALNSGSTQILNSYIADIKAVNADAQAIAGWNGPGPYLIANNYLEAASQNVAFGMAAPFIPTLVPSNITLRGNHITKPLVWRGQSWRIKNLIDLGSAKGVVIDRNVLENSWAATQQGFAVVLTPTLASGVAWSAVDNVEFTNNVVRRVSSVMYISRGGVANGKSVSGVTVRNNFVESASAAQFGGAGAFLMVLGAEDVTVDHNTVVHDGPAVYASTWPTARFVFTNNVVFDHGAAISAPGQIPGTRTISVYFPAGQFLGGVYVGGNIRLYPTSNYYPLTLEAVGFVNPALGNYRLGSTSIYLGGGTDGKDPGYDFTKLP